MSISFSQYLLYLQYMLAAAAMTVLFAGAYLRITPARELSLIGSGNLACALSFGGAVLGFCIALAAGMTHSVSLPDFMLWGVGAALVQIGVYFAATRLIPLASVELENGNTAVGALFCALSLAIGLLNAASLSG